MTNVTTFRRADGSREFTCTGCQTDVALPIAYDDEPVCLTCRFIERTVRPEDRDAVRELLRRNFG